MSGPRRRGLARPLAGAAIPGMGLLDQIVVSAANFGAVLILARAASTAELGAYSLALTVVLLYSAIHEAVVGAPYIVYANRRTLRGPQLFRYTGNALLQSVTLGFVATLLPLGVFGLASMGVFPDQVRDIALMLAVVAWPVVIRDFARRHALAHSHMRLLVLLDILVSTTQVGLLIIFAMRGTLSASMALLALAVASAAGSAAWLWTSRHELLIERAALREHVVEAWKFGRWVLACSVTTVFHGYSIHWVLAAIGGPAMTGLFEVLRSTANIINPLNTGLRNVVGPLAARSFAEAGPRGVQRVVNRMTGFLFITGALFIGFLAVFGDAFIGFAFGSEYTGMVAALLVTAAALVVSGFGLPADQGLWAVERPDISAKASAAGVVITLSLALILIPQLGILGGALALLVGKILETAAKILFLRMLLASTYRAEPPLASRAL